ncbi:MAG: EpsG family protein, partial [Wenzhouxiangellaceae bacterium]
YLAIFLAASTLAWGPGSARRSQRLSYLFALFLVLFAGTRYFVGCDYTGYEIRFEFLYRQETWLSLLGQAEAGFHLINFAIIRLGLAYSDLLLVCSAIYLACLVHFAGLARRPLLVLVLLFPVLVLQLGMSGLRQALA